MHDIVPNVNLYSLETVPDEYKNAHRILPPTNRSQRNSNLLQRNPDPLLLLELTMYKRQSPVFGSEAL